MILSNELGTVLNRLARHESTLWCKNLYRINCQGCDSANPANPTPSHSHHFKPFLCFFAFGKKAWGWKKSISSQYPIVQHWKSKSPSWRPPKTPYRVYQQHCKLVGSYPQGRHSARIYHPKSSDDSPVIIVWLPVNWSVDWVTNQ